MTKKIDAVIVGVHKCATTSLWTMLSQHPSIVTHYSGQLIGDYIPAIKGETKSEYLDELFGKCNKNSCILIRDTTLYDDPPRLGELVNLNPDIKIIVCVRNRVARSYSAFQHALLRGYEKDHKNFSSAMAQLREGKCVKRAPSLLNYFDQSLYGKYLGKMIGVVRPENIFIVNSDYLSTNAVEVCSRCFLHLGVKDLDVEEQYLNPQLELRSRMFNEIVRSSGVAKKVLRRFLGLNFRVRMLRVLNRLNRRTVVGTKRKPISSELKSELVSYFLDDQQKFQELVSKHSIQFQDDGNMAPVLLNRSELITDE